MTDSIVQIIASIPHLVWGAIIGSLTTLLGTIISNRGAQKRLEKQFLHESEQKKIEREQSLKRELFLDIIEKLEKVYVFIAQIPYATPEQISNFSMPSIGKVNAIASEETIIAANDLSAFLGQKTFLFLPRTIPINDLVNEINSASKIISEILDRQKELTTQMATFNIEGNRDLSFFDRLKEQFAGTQNYINILEKEREQHQRQLHRLQKALVFDTYESLSEGIEPYSNFIKCLRKELDMPFDITSYKSDMLKRIDFMKTELQKFMQEVELHIKDDDENAISQQKKYA